MKVRTQSTHEPFGAGLWFDLAAETSGSKEARKGDKEPLLVQLAAVPINRYLEVA